MKVALLPALAGAALLLAHPAAATAPKPPAGGDDWFGRHTEKITDHVWLIYNSRTSLEAPFEGNSVVFEQSDGLVVVDAGGAPIAGRNIVEQIRKISPKPVKRLIYTHFHGDHNLGSGEFRAAWPQVRTISTEQTRIHMTGPPMDYVKTASEHSTASLARARKRLEDPALTGPVREGYERFVAAEEAMVPAYRDLKVYPADETFTDRLVIPDRDTPVEVLFLGKANTDGDAVVWAPRQKVVAAGDIVVAPVPYAGTSYPAEWGDTLARIKKLRFAYLVPGHGPVFTDTAYIDRLRGAIATVRARVAPLVREGYSVNEVGARINVEDLVVAYAPSGDRWTRAGVENFFLGGLVGDAWKQARGEPIRENSRLTLNYSNQISMM